MDNLQDDPEALEAVKPLAKELHISPQAVLTIVFVILTVATIAITIYLRSMHHRYRKKQREFNLHIQDVEKCGVGATNHQDPKTSESNSILPSKNHYRGIHIDSISMPQVRNLRTRDSFNPSPTSEGSNYSYQSEPESRDSMGTTDTLADDILDQYYLNERWDSRGSHNGCEEKHHRAAQPDPLDMKLVITRPTSSFSGLVDLYALRTPLTATKPSFSSSPSPLRNSFTDVETRPRSRELQPVISPIKALPSPSTSHTLSTTLDYRRATRRRVTQPLQSPSVSTIDDTETLVSSYGSTSVFTGRGKVLAQNLPLYSRNLYAQASFSNPRTPPPHQSQIVTSRDPRLEAPSLSRSRPHAPHTSLPSRGPAPMEPAAHKQAIPVKPGRTTTKDKKASRRLRGASLLGEVMRMEAHPTRLPPVNPIPISPCSGRYGRGTNDGGRARWL